MWSLWNNNMKLCIEGIVWDNIFFSFCWCGNLVHTSMWNPPLRLSLQISQTRKRICHAKRVRSKLQGVPSLGVFLFRGQTCALEDVQTCSITMFCSSQPVVFSSHTTPAAASSTSQPTVFSSHTTPAAASGHQPANSVFLSHYSSSSLQHQHSEHGDFG